MFSSVYELAVDVRQICLVLPLLSTCESNGGLTDLQNSKAMICMTLLNRVAKYFFCSITLTNFLLSFVRTMPKRKTTPAACVDKPKRKQMPAPAEPPPPHPSARSQR